MSRARVDRRDFLKTATGSAAVMASLPNAALAWSGRPLAPSPVREDRVVGRQSPPGPPRLRFAVIGLDHPHING